MLLFYLNTIGDNIFIGCKNIKNLNIPQGTLNKKFFDFENMSKLKRIIYEGQEILNLTDKDKFIELVNNGKYIYMNYIDKNLKEINNNNTIGILICKKENKFVIEYCSDDRIIVRKYQVV